MAKCSYTIFAAVFVVALDLTFAGINQQELLKYAEEASRVFGICSKENILSPALAVQILNTVINYDPIPEGPGVKCYIACHLQGTGAAKEGVMLWDSVADMMRTVYPEEDMKKIETAVDICRKSEKKHEASCEWAYEGAKCFYGNLKKLKVTPIKADLPRLRFN